MNSRKILNSQTILEYLVLINERSYSKIGKELGITPQQFSDWIKRRRPIPQERLSALSSYFGIEEPFLINEKGFAKDLDYISKVDIQMKMVRRIIDEGNEESGPYEAKLEQLKKERENQIRLARLAAVLNRNEEQIQIVVDKTLDYIEAGKAMDLLQRIR